MSTSGVAGADLPTGDEKVRAVRSMFDAIAPRYDLVNRIMTFRMDVGWRRRAVRTLDLGPAATVVDLACGTGDLCRDLASAAYRPVGADLSLGMLHHARTAAPLVQADALRLPFGDDCVDGVISGFALRNFVSLPPVFTELARVVRPGGRICLLDVAEPTNPVLRMGHGVYFGKVVPRIGGLLSDPAAYRYLPRSVAYLPAPDQLMASLEASGFGAVKRDVLSGGIAQLFSATRRVATRERGETMTGATSSLSSPARLVARSRWLDGPPVDLLSVAGPDGWLWERDHAGFAGCGVALRIPVNLGAADGVEAVSAALAAMEVDDEVGVPASGPVAVGALPFDPGAPATLLVPSTIVGRTAEGRCWMTTVGTDDPAIRLSESRALDPQDPDGFDLRSPVPHAEWMTLVSEAVDAIDAGRFDKVVLAREVRVLPNRPIHVPTVLRRLRSLYPACTTVSAPVTDGQFVAASPELLVSRIGDRVRSHPLAGTIPRSGDPEADAALARGLMESTKDRAEHAWVVDDVRTALAPWCTELVVPDAPSIVSLRNVSHLGTLITGRLHERGVGGSPSGLELAAMMHPTAAVGGTPRTAALDWLRENERLDRGPYAGPVGWVDGRGDGEWVVGIRSAVVTGGAARLFAGVGVVEGSDPAAELAETQFKLQALLAAVVRP